MKQYIENIGREHFENHHFVSRSRLVTARLALRGQRMVAGGQHVLHRTTEVWRDTFWNDGPTRLSDVSLIAPPTFYVHDESDDLSDAETEVALEAELD